MFRVTPKFLSVILAVLITAAALRDLSASKTSAAEDLFRVVIASQALNTPTQNGSNLATELGWLTVEVGDTTCATISLTDSSNRLPNGDKFVDIGSRALQPGPCRAEAARVLFYDGRARELTFESQVHLGGSVLVTNLAPRPPGTATKGLILGSLSVDGRGLVTGRSTNFQNLLFVTIAPANQPQPLQPIVEWAAIVNENGAFAMVAAPGDYWVIPLNLVLLSPSESIRVLRGAREESVGVRRVHVGLGVATPADLVVSATSFDNPPTPGPVTAPSGGQLPPSSAAVRPPTTGNGGLR